MSPAVQSKDALLDCEQLGLAILKADTVRWLIRDDGGRLETRAERATRYAFNVVTVPLSVAMRLPASGVGDQGSTVLDAADRRIVGLLRLKRDRGCPPTETAERGMTDLQMLQTLEPLMPDEGELDRQVLDRRTNLLDKLRPLLSTP